MAASASTASLVTIRSVLFPDMDTNSPTKGFAPPNLSQRGPSRETSDPSIRNHRSSGDLAVSNRERRIFFMQRIPSKGPIVVLGTLLVGALGSGAAHATPGKKPSLEFDLPVAAGAARCLPDEIGAVRVGSLGWVERMDVDFSGLPADTEFDFFVIQLPTAPFGLAWYQGDIQTDDSGEGHQMFLGRFSSETFIVAQ